MKKNLALLIMLVCACQLFAQTQKGSCMIGGNGSLNFDKNTYDGIGTYKTTSFSLSPVGGYFIINNLSAGLSLPFSQSWSKTDYVNAEESKSNSISIGVAPFVRYYIPVKSFFIITEVSYSWNHSKLDYPRYDGSGGIVGREEATYNSRYFKVAAGPVFFLNPYTSIEILANYQRYAYSGDTPNLDTQINFYISVGFQIYLPSGKPRME